MNQQIPLAGDFLRRLADNAELQKVLSANSIQELRTAAHKIDLCDERLTRIVLALDDPALIRAIMLERALMESDMPADSPVRLAMQEALAARKIDPEKRRCAEAAIEVVEYAHKVLEQRHDSKRKT